MVKHLFDADIAKKYGVNAAIILENFGFWIKKNEANGTNYFDGNYWTFNSRKAFRTLFPYLSEKQIATAIKRLTDEELIVVGNYNKSAYDRTLWYALTEKGKSILQIEEADTDKKAYSIMPKGKMEVNETSNGNVENVTPIPDINTNVNTSVNSYSNNNKGEKKKAKARDFEKSINSYTENEDLKNAIYEFIKMRQLIKKPLTEHALNLMLNNLERLSQDTKTKIDILNQSIQNSWQGVFPLSNQRKQQEPPKPDYSGIPMGETI